MPWIKSSPTGDNIVFIDAKRDVEIREKFMEFLEDQRKQGRTVIPSEVCAGEWDVSDERGPIDTYHVAWPW